MLLQEVMSTESLPCSEDLFSDVVAVSSFGLFVIAEVCSGACSCWSEDVTVAVIIGLLFLHLFATPKHREHILLVSFLEY